MKNRNEDKFGIIVEKDHQFNSLEEAGGYVKDLKDKLKRKASAEEFPITTAMPEDRLKFLEYCIGFMDKKNLPFTDAKKIIRARSVLWFIAKGYTFDAIANFLKKQGFNATIEKIKEIEREGMRMVEDAIAQVKNTQTPVLGGK